MCIHLEWKEVGVSGESQCSYTLSGWRSVSQVSHNVGTLRVDGGRCLS